MLLCLFGFNDEKKSLMIQQEVPPDFNFTIDSGGNDSYNSEYNSFYRKYLNENKMIKVELTKGEKEKIYSFIVKSNFFKMPVKFQPKAGIIIVKDPNFTESIVVYANGKSARTKHFGLFRLNPTIKPGSEIVLPETNEKKDKPFTTFIQLTTVLAQIAGTIATISILNR